MALVRMYKRCTASQQNSHYLSKRGNVMVQWAGEVFTADQDMQAFRRSYKVIQLGHIMRSEYVVPDFSVQPPQAARFFVSKYKWDRYEPDMRPLSQIFGDKYDKGCMIEPQPEETDSESESE
jgi:hypothetical protein